MVNFYAAVCFVVSVGKSENDLCDVELSEFETLKISVTENELHKNFLSKLF